jgi:predicted amidohydrolase
VPKGFEVSLPRDHGSSGTRSPRLRVAACQTSPILGDVHANLASVVATAETLAGSSDLIVLPECALTGYMLTADEAQGVAQEIPGPITSHLINLSRNLDVVLVVGMIERQADALHNVAVVCDRDGGLYVYRKSHLPRMGVDKVCVPGSDGFIPIGTTLGKLGIQICYDFRFPEPSRLLTLRGAELLILIAAWPDTATDYPDFINRCRAAENRLPVVAAASAGRERGTEYLGHSQIVGPDGAVLAEAGPEAAVLKESLAALGLAPAAPVRGRPEGDAGLLGDRRPELYGGLVDSMDART